MTLLYLAVKSNNFEMVNLLLKNKQLDINNYCILILVFNIITNNNNI